MYNAERICNSIPGNKYIFNCAHRKFVILEAENKNEETEDLKERIRNKLKELTERKNVPFELSVSIGSACSENGESLRDLILKADEAMYIAKKKFHKR
ncbi:diguanylate cyclase domain-containing protein [Oribacterium sp. FC2011]|uniref:diguanylate cyclase domain-containing protein n=1 Tax=Oribacterium sp. FC2011 TaxID=1408311 RepID=UPI0004E106A0|nr:diguanylate cyclase [Oribacterium sp. FC2011]